MPRTQQRRLKPRERELFEFWEFMAVKTARDNPQVKPMILNLSRFALDYCAASPDHNMDFGYWFGEDIRQLAEGMKARGQPLTPEAVAKSADAQKPTFWEKLKRVFHPMVFRNALRNLKLRLQRMMGKNVADPAPLSERVKAKSSLIFLDSLKHFCRQFAQDLNESGFVHMMEDVLSAYEEEEAPYEEDVAGLNQDLAVFRHGREVWPQPFPQYWRGYVPEVQGMLNALKDENVDLNLAITYGCNLFYAGTQFMYAAEMLPKIEEDLELVKQVRTVNKDALRPH